VDESIRLYPALDLSASVIADAYTVGLKLGQPLVKVGELKIELVKGDQIGLKPNLKVSDVTLSYPQALYPCR
jgi:hypothetical protein